MPTQTTLIRVLRPVVLTQFRPWLGLEDELPRLSSASRPSGCSRRHCRNDVT